MKLLLHQQKTAALRPFASSAPCGRHASDPLRACQAPAEASQDPPVPPPTHSHCQYLAQPPPTQVTHPVPVQGPLGAQE